MEKIKIGIIGAGHLGRLHAKMLNSISNCNLSGIFDIDQSKSKTLSEEFGTEIFTKQEELLELVDAVSIAATTSAHYDIAMECLRKGKHVFVEKPITATIPQAEEIVKLAAEKN